MRAKSPEFWLTPLHVLWAEVEPRGAVVDGHEVDDVRGEAVGAGVVERVHAVARQATGEGGEGDGDRQCAAVVGGPTPHLGKGLVAAVDAGGVGEGGRLDVE